MTLQSEMQLGKKSLDEIFIKEYCLICGTQRCPTDGEAFDTCQYYKKFKKDEMNEWIRRIYFKNFSK